MVSKRGSLLILIEQQTAAPRRSLLQLAIVCHLFTGPLDRIAHGPATTQPPLPLCLLLAFLLRVMFHVNYPDTRITALGPFASCDKRKKKLQQKKLKREGVYFGS